MRTVADAVDGFCVGEQELGHIHLDVSIHLATSPTLGRASQSIGLTEPGTTCLARNGIVLVLNLDCLLRA